jgi:hypothetical protein
MEAFMAATATSGSGLAFVLALSCVLPLAATAQESDAGLVNQVAGAVSYTGAEGAARPVQAFMKVREGDRISLPAGASVRVLFFRGSRQEAWKGPASFRVGRVQGEAGTGTAEVSVLPSAVPMKMARLPELIQSARLGGVTVRGRPPRPSLTAEEQAELVQARGNYGVLRAQAGSDDNTPELYMISTLQELGLFEEMSPMLDELSRHQPLSPELDDLVRWMRSRQAAPR